MNRFDSAPWKEGPVGQEDKGPVGREKGAAGSWMRLDEWTGAASWGKSRLDVLGDATREKPAFLAHIGRPNGNTAAALFGGQQMDREDGGMIAHWKAMDLPNFGQRRD